MGQIILVYAQVRETLIINIWKHIKSLSNTEKSRNHMNTIVAQLFGNNIMLINKSYFIEEIGSELK